MHRHAVVFMSIAMCVCIYTGLITWTVASWCLHFWLNVLLALTKYNNTKYTPHQFSYMPWWMAEHGIRHWNTPSRTCMCVGSKKVYICIHAYTCTYIYIWLFIYTYVSLLIRIHTCIWSEHYDSLIWTYTSPCISIALCRYMHVCQCVHIFLFLC